jgi:hypothetical protein
VERLVRAESLEQPQTFRMLVVLGVAVQGGSVDLRLAQQAVLVVLAYPAT